MGVSCPTNPDQVLREIVAASKRSLAVWGIASFLIVVAILFVVYSLIQEVMHWSTMNRARKIRLKGKNNVYDAADDDYAPNPGKEYKAPSARAIKFRLKRLYDKKPAEPDPDPVVAAAPDGRDLLDRSKDNYEPEVSDDEDDEDDAEN